MTFDIDAFIHDLGIKDYDELSLDERETYRKMLEISESSKLSFDDVKNHIKSMRESVEFSLATEKLTKDQDIFYKARLKNYNLLEALFDRPEKARKMLNDYKMRVVKK